MDTMILIFRDAYRKLLKTPGASAIAVLAMALGIGLTSAMFGIIQGVYLRGLPFEDGHELMHLECNNLAQERDSLEVSQHDFEIWRRQQTSFDDLVGFTGGTFNLADRGLPERFDGSWVSPGFSDLLGVDPVLGRAFRPADAEPGAQQVLLLSHTVWRQRYGGDDAVLGREVRINTEPATIIGVMPEKFAFPASSEMWMPLVLEAHAEPRGSEKIPTLEVFGRLRDGVTVDEAVSEMSVIAKRLASEYPETNEGVGAVVQPYLEEFIGEKDRQVTGVMFVAVLLVLMIACFNVANLLIGRASVRARELAIRSAIGSRRWHLLAAVLAEASILAFSGAAIGLALAHFALRAFESALEVTSPPFWMEFYLDFKVLLLAVVVTVLSALVSGLVPALQASKPDLRQVLSDSTRGTTSLHVGWVSRVMVVTQVALSSALLIGAGLAVRSVLEASSYDHRFDAEHLISARVGLFDGSYPEDSDRVAFFERLASKLGEQAEVEHVGFGTTLPTDRAIGAGGRNYERPGEEYEQVFQMPWARYTVISPGYFDALGTGVLAGRDFTANDRAESPRVALVNEDFASKEWPGENPIGQRVDLWMGEEAEQADPTAGVVEVVGVVPNLRFAEFDNADDQQGVYVPLAQDPVRFAWILVETRSDPLAFAEPLRRTVLEIDPDLPLYFVRSMEQVLDETMFFPNLLGVLFSTFGGAAIFLACVGLYGLMAFAVSRRTQEMGVRMALGARRGEVLRMVVFQGLGQTVVGLVVGIALGAGLSVVMASFLFQVEPGDPMTFVLVSCLLLGVATLACLAPARRASRVDPMVALRYE